MLFCCSSSSITPVCNLHTLRKDKKIAATTNVKQSCLASMHMKEARRKVVTKDQKYMVQAEIFIIISCTLIDAHMTFVT